MGWSKLAVWALAPSLGMAWLGCGGADAASGHEPVTTPATQSGGGASRAGAAATAGTSAAATAGASAAAMAGHGSGGAAASGGSTSATAGDSSSMAGATGATKNVVVSQLGAREACLPRALPVVDTMRVELEGQVRCTVTFVTVPAAGAACACDASQKLTPTSAPLARAITLQAEQAGDCGATSGVACQDLCQCDLEQASGDTLSQCQTDLRTPIAEIPPGFCYVDLDLTPSLITAAVVASCPVNSQRMLRVLGPTPDPPPLMFLACENP